MEEGVKGTVTSLASLFPVEEAEKAAKRVEEAIAQKQQELDQLHNFIADNNNLVKLVKKLPDELFHDVMVPFGKAAFFPGQLIHTNEFLVLLGEGYYAERTSKQTVDILQRRGKALDSQVDSLKAVMLDLKTEASFFGTTAAEAAEGLVEIREEDYSDEHTSQRVYDLLEDANKEADSDDEEYARIMAKLDELEKEELAAEGFDEINEDDNSETDTSCSTSQDYFDKIPKPSENRSDESTVSNLYFISFSLHDCGMFLEKQLVEKSSVTEKVLLHTESREKVPCDTASEYSSRTRADSFRACSIVEHAHGIQTNPSSHMSSSSQSTESAPSKPVSRFKMQKGGR
ncbi:hypothetical protein IFM89_015232 [Coptis chinensis]|uniref:RNA polymerase II subunit 5-mediating protein homolog n=1 Tax=Coptis chinensis TaxID=261450 RepID=A0A835LEH2_9MAGN|nr:hypothetical protein IFM89_015232 [Coptis chinensis]